MVWESVAGALKTTASDQSATGQALVRDLRQSNAITMEEGHRLLDLIAVSDRAHQAGYQATDEDVAAVRAAVVGLAQGGNAPTSAQAVADAAAAAPAQAAAATPASPQSRAATPLILFALVIALAGGGYYYYTAYYSRGFAATGAGNGALSSAVTRMFGALSVPGLGGHSALSRGIAAYAAGQRDSARVYFRKAVQDDSATATPHIYLGRIAREAGDMSTARTELITAIRIEPNNAVAQREMGSALLAAGNADLARRFYARAVALDPTDRAAQGFLGCTLVRLHRPDEATRLFSGAGAGPWTACVPPTAPSPASGARAPVAGDSTHSF